MDINKKVTIPGGIKLLKRSGARGPVDTFCTYLIATIEIEELTEHRLQGCIGVPW